MRFIKLPQSEAEVSADSVHWVIAVDSEADVGGPALAVAPHVRGGVDDATPGQHRLHLGVHWAKFHFDQQVGCPLQPSGRLAGGFSSDAFSDDWPACF